MELKGILKNFSLPDIVQLIGTARRTGVLIISIGSNRASLYFEDGDITHAEYRDLSGQEVINRIFQEKEGSFQFLSGAKAKKKTFFLDWMSALMEAARHHDERGKGAGGESQTSPETKREKWDAAQVKTRMLEVLKEAFGKKARKIEEELGRCHDTQFAMLEFCDKAEKYIYVFIDRERAKLVADELRTIIEESYR